MGQVKRLRKIKRANKRAKTICQAYRDLGRACENLSLEMKKQFPGLMAIVRRVVDEMNQKLEKRKSNANT